MEVRALARSLRARPSPWLLSSRQPGTLPQYFIRSSTASAGRLNSTTSSSSTPPPPKKSAFSAKDTTATPTPTTSTTQTSEPPTDQSTSQPPSTTEGNPVKLSDDFDNILSGLNLSGQAPKRRLNPVANLRSVFPKSTSATKTNTSGHASQRLFNPSHQDMVMPRKVDLKLGPTLGRQVHVEPERGRDLAAAIRILGSTCKSNQVKQQATRQKFHVRRGQMKKELRRQRWRKLFKFSFQETVKKIQRMQMQGW
ncbi:uncharacterized protein PFLUO_LOCUS3746 [Penicillium psychrofluorescens]|uniref:uncharacterized protein n=1 Tax=Penicillium psychrofluorescens TaxID=3158075 RepID=UPI003CCE3DE5